MTANDKMAFRAEMLRCGAGYRQVVDDAMLAVYFEELKDLELVTLRDAFSDCMNQLKFFPSIVDLRDAEFGVRARQEQAKTKQALIAAEAYDPRRIEGITEAQWQERWAELKRIAQSVPMKPHVPLVPPCHCNDCKREEARRAAR